MPKSPYIICPELPAFDAADLNAVYQAFRTVPPCVLQQAWRSGPETNFSPATVRAGWRNETLLLLAELEDAEIFTFAQQPNERLWELGDTLEIFLRPAKQQAYVELHVAPNNLRLQLRFADAAMVENARKSGSFGKALVPGEIFNSRTWLYPDIYRWYALAEIPAQSVCDKPGPLAGAEWFFSFCRYDYTRGHAAPVISSTSAHTRPDFHRQEEWGTMHFQSRQPIYEYSLVNFDGRHG